MVWLSAHLHRSGDRFAETAFHTCMTSCLELVVGTAQHKSRSCSPVKLAACVRPDETGRRVPQARYSLKIVPKKHL